MKGVVARLCLAVALFWVLVALVGPYLVGHDPLKTDPVNRLAPPSASHLLGTDAVGRDVLARLIGGARVSLSVGLVTTVVAAAIGIVAGLLGGYYRWAANLVMRVNDGLMAFPSILLALTVVAVFGQGYWQVIAALTTVFVPSFVRLVFGEVRALRDSDLVLGAHGIGAGDARILLRHLLPAATSPLLVQASFVFASAVLVEAGLSFVGAGLPPPAPTWGVMVSEGRNFLVRAPWLLWPAAAAITSLVLALSLLGDRLRDVAATGQLRLRRRRGVDAPGIEPVI